jgi:predicted outer membrane protein
VLRVSRRPIVSRIVIALTTAALAAGCRHADDAKSKAAVIPPDSIARDTVGEPVNDTVEVAGEVVDDTAATTTERWLFDPNVLSLLSMMNMRQMSAAEVELGEWHSDTVRAFATQMAHDHAVFQRSIDSLAERLNMMPSRPAIAGQIGAAFQAQIDTMVAARGGPRGSLDRAFVQQQVAGHELMLRYVQQLSGVAERPELRALLSQAATFAKTESARARGMQARLAVADSQAMADSAAKRAARAKRDSARTKGA